MKRFIFLEDLPRYGRNFVLFGDTEKLDEDKNFPFFLERFFVQFFQEGLCPHKTWTIKVQKEEKSR
jgi:hypothetical protein